MRSENVYKGPSIHRNLRYDEKVAQLSFWKN